MPGVGDDAGFLANREVVAVALDRADRGAEIAARAGLRGRRAEQQLVACDARHEVAVPVAAAPMRHKAGDLDLMHRIDHRGRRAMLAEQAADLRDVGERGVLAAEIARDHHAQQSAVAHRANGLVREARRRVDFLAILGRDRRRLTGVVHEIGLGHGVKPPRGRARFRRWRRRSRRSRRRSCG